MSGCSEMIINLYDSVSIQKHKPELFKNVDEYIKAVFIPNFGDNNSFGKYSYKEDNIGNIIYFQIKEIFISIEYRNYKKTFKASYFEYRDGKTFPTQIINSESSTDINKVLTQLTKRIKEYQIKTMFLK